MVVCGGRMGEFWGRLQGFWRVGGKVWRDGVRLGSVGTWALGWLSDGGGTDLRRYFTMVKRGEESRQAGNVIGSGKGQREGISPRTERHRCPRRHWWFDRLTMTPLVVRQAHHERTAREVRAIAYKTPTPSLRPSPESIARLDERNGNVINEFSHWIPACAGMTVLLMRERLSKPGLLSPDPSGFRPRIKYGVTPCLARGRLFFRGNDGSGWFR